ncbi:S9 family peptidase [Brevibacterium aurantiacum]|uniref:S9 family peptidase n=1 Tax=Brevibacterium aurantiacum TaxID=273384 RepID=A0A556C4Q1_BREAU|nr:prolyl oligopeptidase family serine peptidase [Brevibacterium aurantiacum]TSI12427.1 S9 family peptidase [Brevibacterium aurantiacum]
MTEIPQTIDDFLNSSRLTHVAMNEDGTRIVAVVDTVEVSGQISSLVYQIDQKNQVPILLASRQQRVTSVCAVGAEKIYLSEQIPRQSGNVVVEIEENGREREITRVERVRSMDSNEDNGSVLIQCIAPDRIERRSSDYLQHRLRQHYPVRMNDTDTVEILEFFTLDTVTRKLRRHHQDLAQLSIEHEAFPHPDGLRVLANRVRHLQGEIRIDLVLADLINGTVEVVHEEADSRLLAGPISMDGKFTAVQEMHLNERSERRSLAVVDLDTFSRSSLGSGWDRWPTPLAWYPYENSILVRADDEGSTSLFKASVDHDCVEKLADDEGAYGTSLIHPRTADIYSVHATLRNSGHLTRVRNRISTTLGIPEDQPQFEGRQHAITILNREGMPIKCWLTLPHTAGSETPVPLVVWVHGGPAVSWAGWRWARSPWPLVAQGVAVLMPDIAMSTGYGQDFIDRGWGDWGGTPLNDLLDVTSEVGQRSDIDTTRKAVIGTSFGGYLATWAAARTKKFQAAISHAGIWDLELFHPTTDDPARFRRRMPATMRRRHSPRWWVHEIDIPMLISQGGRDTCVPREQAFLQWSELLSSSALSENDQGQSPHRFLYLPTEGHRISTIHGIRDWYRAVTGFLSEQFFVDVPGESAYQSSDTRITPGRGNNDG